MRYYPNQWNGVSGFLDDGKSIEEKAKEELKEEAGIDEADIISISAGKSFEREDPTYNKIWIVNPVLIEVKTDKTKLDWEAQDHRWIGREELRNFDFVPGFDRVVDTFADYWK